MAVMGLAASASASASASAAVLSQGFGHVPPELESRRSAFRKGRRWGYGMSGPMRKGGGNPAGTKLAKKAAKGMLTIIAIR